MKKIALIALMFVFVFVGEAFASGNQQNHCDTCPVDITQLQVLSISGNQDGAFAIGPAALAGAGSYQSNFAGVQTTPGVFGQIGTSATAITTSTGGTLAFTLGNGMAFGVNEGSSQAMGSYYRSFPFLSY